MNVLGLQLDTAWEDKAANHAKLAARLSAAPPEAGTLVVLPEMWATGFSLDVPTVTETPGGETRASMAEQARLYGITLLGGIVTTGPGGRGRNEAVAFGPDGSEAVRYTKMHPFSFGLETTRYGRGGDVLTFPWEGIRVAPFVCYDLRFPEVFRHAVRLGAELFCVLANWPAVREDHWVTLLKARAIENQAYVVGVNRCGHDPSLSYGGRSLIFGPRGELLADGGTDEGMVGARLDMDTLRQYRREFPALDDIHPDYR